MRPPRGPSPLAWLLAAAFALPACSHGADLAPLAQDDAGADAGADGPVDGAGDAKDEADAEGDARDEVDPSLGAPCGKDDDCDDHIDCTADACDPGAGRCRNTPDDARCSNGLACDGEERCDAKLGCQAGPPVSCSDGDPCTLDRCEEGTSEQPARCTSMPRDVDGDGDPDWHCGGGDCDDTNPKVSSLAAEICGNAIDDNCSGTADEEGCVSPANDTCIDPLTMPGPGVYSMPLAGAALDTSASCVPQSSTKVRDVIGAFTVPDGPPQRIDVVVTWPSGADAIAVAKVCGDPTTELACGASTGSTKGGQIARARVHSIEPGTYPVVVYADQDITAQVSVSLSPATEAPTNETCGTASPLTPGETIVAPLVGTKFDVPSRCSGQAPDLVYRLDLAEKHDVRAFAGQIDGAGSAIVSIRNDPCAMVGDEAGCGTGSPAEAFARSLGPGPVFVSVGSSTGGDVSLLVTLEPPTSPPPDESCTSGPPVLTHNADRSLDLTDHTDDVALCVSGYIDAAYALALPDPSDVLLVLRTSSGTQGALTLAKPPCKMADSLVACAAGQGGPTRLSRHGVDAGAYRVVVELSDPTPAELLPMVRKAVAPVYVPFADTCAEAFVIPPEGGWFQGSTANANAETPAGCDQAGAGAFGAPEQFLRLDLPEKRRVVIDSSGSDYATLIDVRKGPACPGKEVPQGCTISYGPGRSLLDLTLEAGTYFIQVDGFNGASGSWSLDVYTAAP